MQAPNSAQPEKLRGSVDYSELPSSSQMLQAPVGVTASVNNGSISNRKRCDMGNRVEVFSTFPISDPQTFLAGSFEARIVSFALCA